MRFSQPSFSIFTIFMSTCVLACQSPAPMVKPDWAEKESVSQDRDIIQVVAWGRGPSRYKAQKQAIENAEGSLRRVRRERLYQSLKDLRKHSLSRPMLAQESESQAFIKAYEDQTESDLKGALLDKASVIDRGDTFVRVAVQLSIRRSQWLPFVGLLGLLKQTRADGIAEALRQHGDDERSQGRLGNARNAYRLAVYQKSAGFEEDFAFISCLVALEQYQEAIRELDELEPFVIKTKYRNGPRRAWNQLMAVALTRRPAPQKVPGEYRSFRTISSSQGCSFALRTVHNDGEPEPAETRLPLPSERIPGGSQRIYELKVYESGRLTIQFNSRPQDREHLFVRLRDPKGAERRLNDAGQAQGVSVKSGELWTLSVRFQGHERSQGEYSVKFRHDTPS